MGILGNVINMGASRALDSLFPRDKGPDPREMVKLGNALDLQSQKDIFDYRIEQGIEYGMTPYEMFMGPAAGAGGGTTGSNQVLGNSATQKNLQAQQLEAEAINKNMDRLTSLEATKMQTDAQVETAKIAAGATTGAAEISAGASKYQADLNKQIADNRLKLDTDRYKYIDVPQASENLKLTKQQIQKTINEVATSEKRFVLYITKLKMGLDNMVAEYIQNAEGIDVTRPETYPKSEEKRRELLGLLLAIQSGTAKNIRGLVEMFSQAQDATMDSVEKSVRGFTFGFEPWKRKMVIPPKR